MTASQALRPTRWTWPLQLFVTVCSVIFTIGTTVQNFVIVNLDLMEDTMRLAGQTPAEAADNASASAAWIAVMRATRPCVGLRSARSLRCSG